MSKIITSDKNSGKGHSAQALRHASGQDCGQ